MACCGGKNYKDSNIENMDFMEVKIKLIEKSGKHDEVVICDKKGNYCPSLGKHS